MIQQRSRLVLVALATIVVAALVTFALVLVDAQRSGRENIEGRLGDRAEAGATLISSVFTSSAQSGRTTAAQRYGRRAIADDALARNAREAQNAFLVVARPDGTVLAASPGTPATVEAALRRRPAWFRAAVTRRVLGSSNIRDSAVPGTLSFAQAFPSEGGERVLVSGSDPKLLAAFFAGSLKRLPAVRGGRIYLLDADGAVLAGSGTRVRLGEMVPEPGLSAPLDQQDRGSISGDRYFAASAIDGTPWRVVIVTPEAELFASVDGLARWGPWALFAAFALAAVAATALAARSFAGARRVAGINLQLEDAKVVLEERAATLGETNHRLEQVNVELARSNAELERFASIASHDLREPLRKVQMFSERVIHHESANLSDRGRDYLGRMDAAAARMQTLIDGLLEYARVTTRAAPLEDVDLGRLARDVADDLDAVRRDVGGRIEVGTLPHVPAEELRMRQLLQNLMSNALRFRRPGIPPVVRVSGHVDGDDIVVEVSDNGIGFEERHADRIFDLFERLHARVDYPGTGMGLALCRRIVERHGGSITATSTPGSGSTFIIRLPRQDEAAAGEPSTPAGDTVPPLVSN
ncbi:MAG: hypothetical protein JWP18_1373 [Solirubrobacterales bacterium]|nr:hypothetical protein [Solirubrobacterales bacterium]